MLLIAALFLGSAAFGFALNHLALRRIRSDQTRAFALAASRAVFYAPSLVDVGHGVHLPSPLLATLASSMREFGPELDVVVFLLPVSVFLGSLALSRSKRFGLWFCTLATAHLILFWALPISFDSFDARAAWFSVNALPWYPLHQLHLPVTRSGLLTLPNALGWIWCLLVWVVLYGSLATALTRLTSWSGAMRR